MARQVSKMLTVSSMTLLSRVLGLLRDMLTAAFLGLTSMASAFFFAFTIPNLFRRMLGEGALTSVFIPLLTDELQEGGSEAAFRFTNVVLSWLLLVLVGLVLVGSALCWGLSVYLGQPGLPDFLLESGRTEQWGIGFQLTVFLMPYMLFICMSAVFAAALNVLGRFAIPALSPVLLNVAMIGSLLLAGWWWEWSLESTVRALCVGVLLGGLFQLCVPAVDLMRQGWRPAFVLAKSERLQELLRLFLPGVLGAAVVQINVLVSRLLAFGLNESAVAALFYANRLVELPLGIFTIAITTVLFPRLSQFASAGDKEGANQAYGQGMRFIFAITVPAAVGLIVLREPIVRLLFEWRNFGNSEVMDTSPLLVIYALSLPFYSLSTFASRGFHSLKDMRTPVKAALIAFVVNLLSAVILMRWMGTPGLALANLISAVVQSMVLHVQLKKKAAHFAVIRYGSALAKIGVAAFCMGVFAWGGNRWMGEWMAEGKAMYFAVVAVVIPLAVLIYFGVLALLKFEDLKVSPRKLLKF